MANGLDLSVFALSQNRKFVRAGGQGVIVVAVHFPIDYTCKLMFGANVSLDYFQLSTGPQTHHLHTTTNAQCRQATALRVIE